MAIGHAFQDSPCVGWLLAVNPAVFILLWPVKDDVVLGAVLSSLLISYWGLALCAMPLLMYSVSWYWADPLHFLAEMLQLHLTRFLSSWLLLG